MNEQHAVLKKQIKQIYRRWRTMVLLKGGAISLLGLAGAILAIMALDLLLDLGNAVRLLLLIGAAVGILGLVFSVIVRPLLRAPTDTQLARYVEEKHPDLDDRLVSAVELGAVHDSRISAVILEKLLDDTNFRIRSLNLRKTVRTRETTVLASVALGVIAVTSTFFLLNLDEFASKLKRVFTPWTIPTVVVHPTLNVSPGNARVPSGSAQEIRAEIGGFETDEVTVYFTNTDSAWQKTTMDPTEKEQVFVYNFFDVQDNTKYYVKAGGLLSKIYRFSTYDAPQITRVDLTYTYPEYTGLKDKYERDTGDVWAPVGTIVKITAVADKPLKSGAITLADKEKLKTSVVSDTLVTASFTVSEDAHYDIRITDVDLLTNDPPPEYFVHAIPDEPPMITVEKPGHDVKASMVEEVPVKISVLDDFGVSALKLHYTLNDDKERVIDLKTRAVENGETETTLNELRDFKAEYMFYLEDMNVQPGDFLTYYIEAFDNSSSDKSAATDILFIEVRPFEKEFYRALSQGGAGGGAMSGAQLSGTQKDILVATWKLNQRKQKLSEKEWRESVDVIIESQGNLQDVAEGVVFQMQQRSLFTEDAGESQEVVAYFTRAIKAMEGALDQLKKAALGEALGPEREAYQNLLRAESLVKKFQMNMSQGGGLGSPASLDELAQLFEDEMDKLNNKYETLQQNQQHNTDQQMNEALQKVRELAKRQQLLNQQARELARNQSEEEKKRKAEELRRQQEQIRREMQQLTRDMQQMRQSGERLSKDMQNSLRQASSEMNETSKELHNDMETAAAKGQRALNRLKRLENELRRNLDESMRQEYERMMQEFQQLAESQKQLTKDVESLSGEEKEDEQALREVSEDQGHLQEDFSEFRKDLQGLNTSAQQSRKEVTRDLSKLTHDFDASNVDKKMETAQDLLQKNRLNSALQAERDILTMMERLAEKMTRLRSQFAESDQDKLELALDQTQELRENLESLKRSGESPGQTPQEPSQTGEKQSATQEAPLSQAGPGESGPPPQQLSREQMEKWNEELAQAMKNMESIGQSVQVDTSLYDDYRELSGRLQNFVRNYRGGDPNKYQLIESMVLDPIRRFEAELAQKLELMQNKEKLFLAREENIPPEYEALVEQYYESLSKTK